MGPIVAVFYNWHELKYIRPFHTKIRLFCGLPRACIAVISQPMTLKDETDGSYILYRKEIANIRTLFLTFLSSQTQLGNLICFHCEYQSRKLRFLCTSCRRIEGAT